MAPGPAAAVVPAIPPWNHGHCCLSLRGLGQGQPAFSKPSLALARRRVASPLVDARGSSLLVKAPLQGIRTRIRPSMLPREAGCAHLAPRASSPAVLLPLHSAAGSMGGGGAQLELRERVRARAESERSASSSNAGSSLLADGISQLVAAFLRTQCSRLSKLEVRVGGEAGALLRGHVPEARVEAEDACFKGLCLSHLTISATHIQLQRPQIPGPEFPFALPLAKRRVAPQPRTPSAPRSSSILQHKFGVTARAHMSQQHLNASLASHLMQDALRSLLPSPSQGTQKPQPRGPGRPTVRPRVDWSRVRIHTGTDGVITLSGASGGIPSAHSTGTNRDPEGTGAESSSQGVLSYKVSLRSSGRHIEVRRLSHRSGQGAGAGAGAGAAEEGVMVFDLGSDTRLDTLTVGPGGIFVGGTFTVHP